MVLIISLLYWYLFQRQLLKNQIKSINFPFLFNQWLGKMYTIQYQQRLIWSLTFITTVNSYQYHIWLWVYYIKVQVNRRPYSLDHRPWRTISMPHLQPLEPRWPWNCLSISPTTAMPSVTTGALAHPHLEIRVPDLPTGGLSL